ncbi:DNA cytosine methyltransferase [Streptomyces lycii]|uniref:DNA cytosine methyltransferase n=1 Tax=Streptomyces lycii TaxID=2654337 RepID=A0ABQ7FIN8_9ACTN|nr:DNA cytosine methyltransferase [Streptomyces lycii]
MVLLFKTPTAQLGRNGAAQHPDKRKAGGHGPTLDDEVVYLLPTPTTSDGTGGPGTSPHRKGGMNLRTAVTTLPDPDADLVQDWGKYEPAIRRQEAWMGRAAPIPTETGPRGGRRLTARFAEWLMGLPDGWVTATPGLSRADQLHAIGNGVVPQQAYEAYRRLLDA